MSRNFDIRKSLLKFDDVLNDQRHVIFSQRKKVMESENSYEFAENFLNHIIEGLSQNSKKNLNIDKQIQSSFGTAFNQDEIDILKTSAKKI